MLREKIIAISSTVKKLKKQKLLDLEIKLKELQKEHSSSLQDSVRVKMFEVKQEINEINTGRSKKSFFLQNNNTTILEGKRLNFCHID